MDFKVIWSDPAIESLGEIVRHVARKNAPAALRLGQQLVARAEITARFQESGPIYRPASPLVIRSLSEGNYRIYYRVLPAPRTVEIVAVRHSARRQPEF